MINIEDQYIVLNPEGIPAKKVELLKQKNKDTISVVLSKSQGIENKSDIKFDEQKLRQWLSNKGQEALDNFKQNGKFPLLKYIGIDPLKDILNYPIVQFFKFKQQKALAFFATLIYFGFKKEKIQEFYDLVIVKQKNNLLFGIDVKQHSNLLYRILMGIIKDEEFDINDFQSYGYKILYEIFYQFDVIDIILKNTKESKKNEQKDKIDKFDFKQIILLYLNSPKFTSFKEEHIQRLFCFFESYYKKIGIEQKVSQVKQLIFQNVGLYKIEEDYIKKYIEDYSQIQCDQQQDLRRFFEQQAKSQRYLVKQNHELKKQLSEQEDLYRKSIMFNEMNKNVDFQNESFFKMKENCVNQNMQNSQKKHIKQQPHSNGQQQLQKQQYQKIDQLSSYRKNEVNQIFQQSYLQKQNQNQQQQISNQSFYRNNTANQNFQQSNYIQQSQYPNLSQQNIQSQSKVVQNNTSNDRFQSNFQSNDQKKSSNEILANKQNPISNQNTFYENNHNGILHVPDLNMKELTEQYNCLQNPSIQLSCTHKICSKCVFHDYLQKKIGVDVFQMFDLKEEIFNNRKIQCVKKDCKTLFTYQEFKNLVDINKVDFGMI